MKKMTVQGSSLIQGSENPASVNNNTVEAFAELERGIHAALETYSNVHRGSGHNSMVSTLLFDKARDIVLEYLELNKRKFVVVFCTPGRAEVLKGQLIPESFKTVSSLDIGLSLGVRALAVDRKALPKGTPFQTGGGTTRLVSPGWVIWADTPDKFEAGTPAIINIIAFARALSLIRQYGNRIFLDSNTEKLTATEILYHDELDSYSGKDLLDELRKTLIGIDIRVPTVEGLRPFINLDNSASTPTFTPIWDSFRKTWRQPEAIQREVIHEVKSICAEVLGASPNLYDLIFTSNTTEAINLAAENLSRESDPGSEPVVLSSLLEHSSNDLPWRMVSRYPLIRLSVDVDGFVDLAYLDKLLCEYNQKKLYGNKRIKILAISGASNVLGIHNDLAEISRIVHRYGSHLLVDAAQLVAHRKVDMEGCGIDYLAFSAHKVYAPFGCGGLMAKKDLINFSSAELEFIKSSGEENAGGIAALGKSLLLLQRIGMELIQEKEQALTSLALRRLAQVPGIMIYGMKDPDSPRFAQKGGIIVFNLKAIMAPRVAKELAERGGIGVRCGCHCAHILIKHLVGVPPLLERFQRLLVTLFPKLRLPGVVRISLGIENSSDDVDKLIFVLGKISKNSRVPAGKPSHSKEDGKSIISLAEVRKQINDFAEDAVRRVYSHS